VRDKVYKASYGSVVVENRELPCPAHEEPFDTLQDAVIQDGFEDVDTAD
jgi:hypothetical protein